MTPTETPVDEEIVLEVNTSTPNTSISRGTPSTPTSTSTPTSPRQQSFRRSLTSKRLTLDSSELFANAQSNQYWSLLLSLLNSTCLHKSHVELINYSLKLSTDDRAAVMKDLDSVKNVMKRSNIVNFYLIQYGIYRFGGKGAIQTFTENIEQLNAAPDLDELHKRNLMSVYLHARGALYLIEKKYEETIVDYSNALELDPEYALAYINRGNAYFYLNKYQEAIQDFNKQMEIDPSLNLAFMLRGIAHLKLNNLEESLRDLTQALCFTVDNPTIFFNRGTVYYKMGNWQLALNDFTEALRLNPQDSFSEEKRKQCMDKLEGSKKSTTERAEAEELTVDTSVVFVADQRKEEVSVPEEVPAIEIHEPLVLVQELEEQNVVEEVSDRSVSPKSVVEEPVVAVYKEKVKPKLKVDIPSATFKSEATHSEPIFSETLVKQCWKLLKKVFRCDQVYACLEELTQYWSGITFESKTRVIQALKDESVLWKGTLNGYVLKYGVIRLTKDPILDQDLATFVSDVKESSLPRKERLNLLTLLYRFWANSNYHRANYEEAIKYYTLELEDSETCDIGLFNNRGNAYMKLKQYGQAIQDYNRSIAISPSTLSYCNRSTAFIAVSEIEQAAEDCRRALEIDPYCLAAWINLGLSLRYESKYQEALDVFLKSVELNPTEPIAFNNAGLVLCDLNRYLESLEYFSRALAIQPHYSLAQHNRGFSHMKLKRYTQAINDFSDAIDNNSSDARSFFCRSVCYFQIKETRRALEDAKEAVRMNPDYLSSPKFVEHIKNIHASK